MDTKRFQTSQYRQQINAARHYQRRARPKPFTPGQKFLYYIGLGTILNRVIAFLILGILIYLTYFASFLKFQQPVIKGADDVATQEVLSFFDSFKESYLYKVLPQKNIVYFNNQDFITYLLNNDYKIAEVSSIKKELPNRITITVKQRVPILVVQIKDQYYILNSDGKISNKVDEAGASSFVRVVDVAEDQINQGEKFIEDSSFHFLSYLRENFESKTGLAIERYEIPGRGSDQIIVYTKKGFKIMFNSKMDPEVFLDRFTKLWAAMKPEQQNSLVYADLRFETNAYACYRGAACSQ